MRKTGLAVALAALAGYAKGVADEVMVVPSRAVIVSTQKGGQAAAEELALHLKIITGTDVPVRAKAEPGAFAFVLEPGKLRNNDEACDWCVTPSNAVFRGNVTFAVVDFLENALGVRWPEGDFVSCQPQNPLRITQLSGTWTPELNIRTIRGQDGGEAYRAFSRRMRGGRHDAPKYGHAFTAYWKRFGKTHPEFFAMRKDGVRAPRGVKPADLLDDIAVYNRSGNTVGMCVTCEGFQDQVVADWVADGKPEYINLCENDVTGPESCQCPACTALDVVPAKVNPKWETHYADRYVWFGNRILVKARKFRPDVKVSYYGYNATQDAPSREHPDEASVIGIVPTIFTDDYVAHYVDSWREAGARHFFYRPNRHHYYRCPYLPTGSEEHFFDIFRTLREKGCIGFDYDAPAAVDGGFDWLGAYVLFHAMQDPAKPYSHWEDHFCQAYGAAADDVKAYYRYWREEVWNKRLEPNLDLIVEKGRCFNFGRGLLTNLKDYYRAADFAATEKFVAAAEAKATAGSQHEAVARLRVAHDHARVFFEAVAHKSKANTEALIAYRRAHGYPLYTWAEQYFGDITGVEGLLGPEKKGVPPPPPGPEAWSFRKELAEEAPPDYAPPTGTPWLENRISRCFFSPIKRPPFNRDELKDDIDYYPDNYLERLRREGVNGLWLTVALDDLDEKSFAKLRRTVEKCAAHGIRVWAFCIEPRSRPHDDPFFAAHPDARGAVSWDGRHVNCPSSPAMLADLEAKVTRLFRAAPGLAGMICIANGERATTCLSFAHPADDDATIPCARCSKRPAWELYADVAAVMAKGMRSVCPQAKLITWFYQPDAKPARGRWVLDCAQHVPEGVELLYNFESGSEREQVGKMRCGGDYWLSVPGPAEPFRAVSAASRAAGLSLAAKIQTSCSHECATVPYVPVPGLLYRKFKGMREAGVRDVMMCWFFGNAPGLMNRAAGRLAYETFEDGEEAFLRRLAKDEWGEDADVMGELWKKFSDAYSHYPLSNAIQYYGPFHAGFSWPLYPNVSMRSLQRTWKPMETPGGDLLGETLQEFSLEDALACAEAMTKELDGVRPVLAGLRGKYAGNRARRRDLGIMVTLMDLFESAKDIFRFYLLRRDAVFASRANGNAAKALGNVAEMKAILVREKAISREMMPLCDDDSRLGFHSEAEAHQFTSAYLAWRVGELEKAEAELKAIENALRGGRPWPESVRERTAETMAAEERTDGSIVLSGDCPELAPGQEMELRVYDLCGTAPALVRAVHPKGGRYSVTLSPTDWQRDPRLKPAWAVVRQGKDYNNGGTTWARPAVPMFPEPRLIQSALTGDNFARIVFRRGK